MLACCTAVDPTGQLTLLLGLLAESLAQRVRHVDRWWLVEGWFGEEGAVDWSLRVDVL